jgi:hypothetical protein
MEAVRKIGIGHVTSRIWAETLLPWGGVPRSSRSALAMPSLGSLPQGKNPFGVTYAYFSDSL